MPFSHFALLFFTGTCGWLAQEGVSVAISIEKAGRVAILNYFQIVICFIFDVAFLGKSVSWTDILGTILIIIFTLLSNIQKNFFDQDDEDQKELEKFRNEIFNDSIDQKPKA